ncbi:MAG: hypothetical protein GF344_15065 [Chitinivibrionales bacterium]|nr:hypothetical protein [Chitinivibrionales bacterium]MBD3358028.1 hypothetical protein [Chitinivibrionales bacterium]
MEESPSEKQLRQRLSASRFSAEGFLGEDNRSIDEIINEDTGTLERSAVSHEQLVTALKEVYGRAREALGAEITLKQGVAARYYESMGKIPSPYRGDGVFEKGEVIVRNADGSRRIIITSLGIALIEKHGFFQGKGSRYRIEPSTAIDLLEVKPYSTKRQS